MLVVDDEESYRQALASGLTREGFAVEIAGDGHEALRLFHRVHPDLVLLDVMLPDQSGIELCQQMRALKPVPIIMVTARDSEVDVVLGLELGASDYVAKPFRLRELVARMRAVLRRGVAVAEHHDEVLHVGPVRLDAGRREVTVNETSGRPLPQGVRPPRPPDVPQRPGRHPRLVHRPAVVGPGADRHPDARHAHQAAPPQGRARSGQSPPPGHRAGRGVPLRGRRRGRADDAGPLYIERMHKGDVVPDFELPDQTGTPRTLSELLAGGPVVLFFYPAAMTYGCTKESCHFRDLGAEFAAVGAQPVGISADPVDKQKQFDEKESLGFPLLSDPDRTVAAQLGVPRDRRELPAEQADRPSSSTPTAPCSTSSTREVSMGAHADKALASSGATGAA